MARRAYKWLTAALKRAFGFVNPHIPETMAELLVRLDEEERRKGR